MVLVQYSRQDFLDVKNNYKIPDNIEAKYQDIINTIESQILHQSKYQSHKSYHNHGRNNYNDDWRRKKLPSFLDRKISEEDRLRNMINLELNKISIENYDQVAIKIKSILTEISTEKYTDIMSLIIDNVFQKAVMQPMFCPYYVKMVFLLIHGQNKNIVITLLRNKCTIYHQILSGQHQEDEDNDDKVISDYDKLCQENLRKDYKKGFSQFVGELYNYDIITTREILFFYHKMLLNIHKGLQHKNKIDVEYVEDNIIYFQKLIEMSIQKLIQKQHNLNPIYQFIDDIDKIIKHNHIDDIPCRLKFKLRDCQDLLKKSFKKKHR